MEKKCQCLGFKLDRYVLLNDWIFMGSIYFLPHFSLNVHILSLFCEEKKYFLGLTIFLIVREAVKAPNHISKTLSTKVTLFKFFCHKKSTVEAPKWQKNFLKYDLISIWFMFQNFPQIIDKISHNNLSTEIKTFKTCWNYLEQTFS